MQALVETGVVSFFKHSIDYAFSPLHGKRYVVCYKTTEGLFCSNNVIIVITISTTTISIGRNLLTEDGDGNNSGILRLEHNSKHTHGR